MVEKKLKDSNFPAWHQRNLEPVKAEPVPKKKVPK